MLSIYNLIFTEVPKMDKKYTGVIPAFYACYDDEGNVSAERTKALVEFLIEK